MKKDTYTSPRFCIYEVLLEQVIAASGDAGWLSFEPFEEENYEMAL